MDKEIIKVLLIESNPVQALIFQQMLKRAKTGSFVVTYSSKLGDSFIILKNEKNTFDIIISDLFLEDSQSLNTIIEFKKIKPNIPILILTSFEDEKLALEAVKKGAQDYLIKDKISQDSLIRCVKYSIERYKYQTVIEQQNQLLKQQNQELILMNQKLENLRNNLEVEVKEKTINLENAFQECQNFEYILEKLVEGTSAVIGEDFFAALVLNLASVLGVRYVVIAKLIKDQLFTIAFTDNCKIQANFNYQFKNTPCAKTLELGEYYCFNNLNSECSQQSDLIPLNMNSYYGIALKDSQNQTIGNICILDEKEIKNIEKIKRIIKIFATRAVSEIERQKAENQLQKLNQELELRVKNRTQELALSREKLRKNEQLLSLTIDYTPIGLVTANMTGKIINVNLAFCRIFGYSKDELLTMNFLELIPENERNIFFSEIHSLIDNPNLHLTLEKKYRQKNGHIISTITRIVGIQELDQSFLQFVATVEDLSYLKEKETQLQQYIKELSDFKYALDEAAIVSITDINGNIIYANNKFCQISKYSLNEILGKNHNLINSGYHQRDIFANLWQTITQGKIWRGELKNKNKHGGFYWVDNTIVPFLDNKNKPIQYLSISTDITNRKTMEDVLYKSNKLLTMITLTQSQFITDSNYEILFDNILTNILELANRNYGFIAEIISGKDISESFYVQRKIDSYQTNNREQKLEKIKKYHPLSIKTTINKLSQQLSIEGRFYPFLILPVYHGQELLCFVGINENYDQDLIDYLSPFLTTCGNIIKAYRNEQKRLETEQLLKQQLTAIESASDGIGILNLQGEYIYINRAHLTLFGYEKNEDLLGKSWQTLYNKSEYERLENKALSILFKEKKWRGEAVAQRKDGTNFIQEISLTLIDNIGIVCVCQDITERKKAEENILKSLAKEKDLNQLKSRFISITSHEFRTPLSIISSSAGILELYSNKIDQTKKEKHLQRIQNTVNNMTQLLEDVLTINNSETNHLEYRPSPINLVSYCYKLLEDLESTLINHSFTYNIDIPLNFIVFLDEKLMRQVLTNLLSNGVKYSPYGSKIEFNLSLTNNFLVFEVKDQGIGIPIEDQHHLFELFHRGHNVGNIQGTGLGLAIVKKCVELHQGQITFSSKIGKGTTFSVQIPLKYHINDSPS